MIAITGFHRVLQASLLITDCKKTGRQSSCLRFPLTWMSEVLSQINGVSLLDNGFVLLGSLLCASVRSLSSDTAKLAALDLLSALSLLVRDEYRLDRILPYIVSFFSDHSSHVRASAIR